MCSSTSTCGSYLSCEQHNDAGSSLDNKLSTAERLTAAIAAWSKSLYAFRVLQTHGMPTPTLHSAYRATVLAKLLHRNQAWSSFCRAAADRIDAFVHQSKRNGYCADSVPPVAELFVDSDMTMFKQVWINKNHILHHMLPPLTNHSYNFRKRLHNHLLQEMYFIS